MSDPATVEALKRDFRAKLFCELGRFPAVSGRAWATPALAGDLLLVRSDAEAACYRLPAETAAARSSRTGGD